MKAEVHLKQTETFKKWRLKLRDVQARAMIAARLSRLQFGHEGDVKVLGNGISELRVHFGPGYRIYFQRRGSEIVILLCGGDKGTQARDIQAARKLAEEWRDRDERNLDTL